MDEAVIRARVYHIEEGVYASFYFAFVLSVTRYATLAYIVILYRGPTYFSVLLSAILRFPLMPPAVPLLSLSPLRIAGSKAGDIIPDRLRHDSRPAFRFDGV
jgi:hypothetical protein